MRKKTNVLEKAQASSAFRWDVSNSRGLSVSKLFKKIAIVIRALAEPLVIGFQRRSINQKPFNSCKNLKTKIKTSGLGKWVFLVIK